MTNFKKRWNTWARNGVAIKPPPLIQRLRLRYGLRWTRETPPIARPLFAVFIVLLLGTLALSIDQRIEREQEEASSWASQFADCLNGVWRGRAGDYEIGCFPAETNKRI